MQYSLRTLFLLVLAAALLVVLAKAPPTFRELILATALAYTGLAGLAMLIPLGVKRGHVWLPALAALPVLLLVLLAGAGTAAILVRLVMTGLSSI